VPFSIHAQYNCVDRKRTQSIAAAEAGIDLTLQTMSGTVLPCTVANSLGTGPTQSSYSVTVTYYNSAGSALTCTNGVGPSATPASAELASTGTTNATGYGDRLMHAFVKITPTLTGGFDKAIFADSFLTFNNNTTIQGNGANNADLYTNSTYTCTNNQFIYGDVYSQGDITASNTCSAAGLAKKDLHPGGGGNASLPVHRRQSRTIINGNTSLNAVAKGIIQPLPCGPGQQIAGTCSQNANPGDPPAEVFPVLDWNATAWTGAGYTVVDEGSNCAKLYTDLAGMATSTTKTAFLTTCTVDWGQQNTWTFNTDVAVWASGGMNTTNQVNMKSASAAQHYFHMISPTTPSPRRPPSAVLWQH
jgi:hypothetical protein